MNCRRPCLVWLVLAVALAVLASGCAKHEAAQQRLDCPGLDGGKPVDPVLLAFLSRARAAHHLADQYEEQEEPAGAIAALEKLVRGPVPGGESPPPEAREVLSDTRARLADLESQLGRFDDAAEDVDEGLKLAPEPSYYQGHLFEVRGLLEDRRSKALAKSGKTDQAKQARERALQAFEKSMRVQAGVIKKAVPDAGSP